jgi:hypothetical protein
MFVREDSVDDVKANARDYGKRIIRAIKLGMREGMDILAALVSGQLHSKTGQTAASVQHGVRVTETVAEIIGRIGLGFVGREPRGIWIERGTKAHIIEAAKGGLGETLRSVGRGAHVLSDGSRFFGRIVHHPGQSARPVFEPSLSALKEEIMARIQLRMDQVQP